MIRSAGSLQLAIVIGAGLATGLARFPDPVAVVIAILAGAWLTRRAAHIALATSAALAVAIGASLGAARPTSCANRLAPGEHRLVVRLVDPGHAVGRTTPIDLDCQGTVRTRWPRDADVAAGRTAEVTARWLPRNGPLGRPGGTLTVRRIKSVTGVPSWLAESRNVVSRHTAALFGPRAGLVDALVAGRSGGIDPDVRDRFAAAGLVHVLSISGFHMGLLALWLVLAFRLFRMPPRHAEALAAMAVLGYAAWLGWPPPATRAAALCVVVVLTRRRQRMVRADGLLGASALVVLIIDPWSVVDLGAWLSFSAMAGVLWLSRWYRRRSTNSTGEAIAGSIGATLTTAPIAALTIGRVAAIGPLVNLVGLPVAALVVPAIFLALGTAMVIPAAAAPFAASATVLLALLDRVAAIGASLRGAAGASMPGWSAALPWLALLLIALHATHGDTSTREALRRTGWGCAVMLWWPLLAGTLSVRGNGGGLGLHFLDVGQGDAAVLRTPGNQWVVIDAGPADAGYDAGRRVVVPFLERHGARAITLLVVTHAHRDHVGGAAAVSGRLPIGAALEPAEPFDEAGYLAWLDTLAVRRVPWLTARPGMRWRIDGVEFEVLHPPTEWAARGLDLNEDSVVLLVRYGEFVALFTGDAGLPAEALWQDSAGRVDLLKVGHHGSAGATGVALLDAVQPQVAVISLGRNRYGHPAPATLDRLAAAGVAVWRTDLAGTVSVETDGQWFHVRDGRSVATYDARDPIPETTPCCIPPR